MNSELTHRILVAGTGKAQVQVRLLRMVQVVSKCGIDREATLAEALRVSHALSLHRLRHRRLLRLVQVHRLQAQVHHHLLPLRRPRAQLGLVLHTPPLRTHSRHATPLLSSVTLDPKTAVYNQAEGSVNQGPLPGALCLLAKWRIATRSVEHLNALSWQLFHRRRHGSRRPTATMTC